MYFPTVEEYRQKLSVNNPIQQGGTPADFLPIVSIITVVYNGEEFLQKTIESIIKQDYSFIEYIIIDGNSQDGTLEIIKKYQAHITYWRSETDIGLYDAMNKGISLARASIIGLLNAGDTYMPEALSLVVKHHQMDANAIIIGDCQELLGSENAWWIKRANMKSFPSKMLPHTATFVPLAVYLEQGLFDVEHLRIASDYDFLYRCYLQGVKFSILQEVVSIANPPGASGKYYQVAWEMLIIRLRHKESTLTALRMFFYSCITITGHKVLEYIGLWRIVEKYRHGSIR